MSKLTRTQADPKISMLQKNLQPTLRVKLQCNDPLITEQHHAKSCDINNILARAIKNNGLISHVNSMQGDYSGLASQIDYHEAVNAVMAADNSFNLLPASIRTQFENDPAQFLDFVDNADQSDLKELGLLPTAEQSSFLDPSSEEPTTPAADPVPDAENTPPA